MSKYLTITKPFLGLAKKLVKKTRYFVFMTLPFGLSTGRFLSTKVLKLLMKYWRLHATGMAYFLDDDISIQFGISNFN